MTRSGMHPVGTCRIGTDLYAVVDADLRVRGVSMLRVVDTSVLADPFRREHEAMIPAVAEHTADLVKISG